MSSLDRLLKCAAGEALGGVDEKSERAKVAAAWGDIAHHWKATGEVDETVVDPEYRNLIPLFRKKLRECAIDREQWWPSNTIHHETAVAMQPFTAYDWMIEGSAVEKDDWKASHSDEWLTGTCDGWGWLFGEGNGLWVDDLKTGRLATLEGCIEQIKGYALAIARVLDYRGDVHATMTHWPRYRLAQGPQRHGRVITAVELNEHEHRLKALRDEMARPASEMTLNPGEAQCMWCPGRSVCSEGGYSAVEMN